MCTSEQTNKQTNIFDIPTLQLGKHPQEWQNIPVYLSERIESVQMRAFKIIYPDSSYNQALILAKETTLSSRREFLILCDKLLADMNKNSDHPLSFLVSVPAEYITIPYNLISDALRPITKLRRTKRTEDFFTFSFRTMDHVTKKRSPTVDFNFFPAVGRKVRSPIVRTI